MATPRTSCLLTKRSKPRPKKKRPQLRSTLRRISAATQTRIIKRRKLWTRMRRLRMARTRSPAVAWVKTFRSRFPAWAWATLGRTPRLRARNIHKLMQIMPKRAGITRESARSLREVAHLMLLVDTWSTTFNPFKDENASQITVFKAWRATSTIPWSCLATLTNYG